MGGMAGTDIGLFDELHSGGGVYVVSSKCFEADYLSQH